MPADYIVQPCTYYFVHLDSKQHPIPGTQFAKHTNNLDPGQTSCTEARLPNYQMVAPAGTKQCFNKEGWRYFYQLNNLNKQVVPNSLIAIKGKPAQMCVGTNTYLEYKLFA